MPQFTITNGETTKKFGFPDAPVITLGRALSNDLLLPDSALKVSRAHAAVIRLSGVKQTYFVRDLSSVHGVRVGGRFVDQHKLRDGDILEISDYRLLYSEHGEPGPCSSRLRFSSPGNSPAPTTVASAGTQSTVPRLPSISDKMQEAIVEIAERNSRISDTRLLFSELLLDIRKLMRAERGFVAMFRDREGTDYDERALVGLNALDQIELSDRDALHRVLHGEAVQEGATAMAPLLQQGAIQGFICIDGSRVRLPYSAEEMALLISIGRFAADCHRTPHSSNLEGRHEWGIEVIGKTHEMSELLDAVQTAAADDSNILIMGETGTGKELVARAVHAQSARSSGPFVARNCALLTETLAQTEIFGHAPRSGIYGADPQGSAGWFELANGGSLLLDEIHALPQAIQDQFLRVLQDRQVLRVRASTPVSVDVKVIAATDHDLEQAVEQGRFRRALYFRFGKKLRAPPLRERRDDIVLLAHAFLDNFAATRGTRARFLSRRALEQLLHYDWPGNVRELSDVILSAAQSGREVILSWDLDARFARTRPGTTGDTERASKTGEQLQIAAVEKCKIMEALETTRGNISRAQGLLGYRSRQTMLNKMAAYGIPRDYGDPLDSYPGTSA